MASEGAQAKQTTTEIVIAQTASSSFQVIFQVLVIGDALLVLYPSTAISPYDDDPSVVKILPGE